MARRQTETTYLEGVSVAQAVLDRLDGFPKQPLHKIVCIGALGVARLANRKAGVSMPLERLTSASGRRQN